MIYLIYDDSLLTIFFLIWINYHFRPYFRSVGCGWSSFWHNV